MSRRVGARVGVVHFGSTAPEHLVLPLTDVRRRKVIEAAMAIPPSLGGTAVATAMSRGRQVLGPPDPERIGVVVVITDGIEAVGTEVAAQLNALPAGSVHVLLVDHSRGCDPVLEAGWSALALGSFTRLDVLDTARLGQQVAEVVAQAATSVSPPSESARHPSPRTPGGTP